MNLSSDQVWAFEALKEWKASGHPEFTLAGLAGTGKTTLIREAIHGENKLFDDVHVMALAGKAASVLRSKGVFATTIHSHIYNPPDKHSQGCWVKKPGQEVPGKVFIVDEASMVSTDLYRDLLSFGRPILWVGDHGQLEPIGENPRLMETASIKLERIHRQAEDSPIIAFAHALRSARPFKERVSDALTLCQTAKGSLVEHVLEEKPDQVIVGFNKTRHAVNAAIRGGLGYKGSPQAGDRVICIKNHRNQGVFNGMQATIISLKKESENYVWCDIDVEGQIMDNVKMAKRSFGVDLPSDVKIKDADTTLWDYAYAITCHKSQGSEWKHVLVYEQLVDSWDPRRWSYTAATRAAQKLTYISGRCLK